MSVCPGLAWHTLPSSACARQEEREDARAAGFSHGGILDWADPARRRLLEIYEEPGPGQQDASRRLHQHTPSPSGDWVCTDNAYIVGHTRGRAYICSLHAALCPLPSGRRVSTREARETYERYFVCVAKELLTAYPYHVWSSASMQSSELGVGLNPRQTSHTLSQPTRHPTSDGRARDGQQYTAQHNSTARPARPATPDEQWERKRGKTFEEKVLVPRRGEAAVLLQ
ncbi:hypothetical protein C8034_v011841 [Colletotrichum sidae]|uniref:Uncharacterized protein n=1 Tax=Colletotrichum sidae TaxID=1347389 RepID=A0A4R8THN0_9PEZI|nr:hypothetical protein C8034_v011841 [Colletotrichum sidae]